MALMDKFTDKLDQELSALVAQGRERSPPLVNEDIPKISEPIPQTVHIPRLIEQAAGEVEVNFNRTADELDAIALKIEDRVIDLRRRAEWLRSRVVIAKELRDAVMEEQLCHQEVQSLALVDVGMHKNESN